MKYEKTYIFGMFLLVFLLNINNLILPYHWDDFNYVISAADYIYNNEITIFLWDQALGHPPLFFIISGMIFKLFGESLLVSHVIVVIFSFLAVLFTYLISKELFSVKTAVISSLLLIFTPIFLSYSALFYSEISLTAFILMAIYFSIKNKPLISVLFGSLAVLTKEVGVVAVLGILIAKLIKGNEKKNFIYSIPLVIFLILISLNKIHYGYFLFPRHISLIKLNLIKNSLVFILMLKTIFFDQFRWVLTSLIPLSLLSKDCFKKKNIILSLILSFTLIILIFSLKFFKFETYFPNFGNYLMVLERFSILIALLAFLFFLSIKKFIIIYNKKNLYELYFPLIFIMGMHFFIIPFVPRYILPIYPILAILFAISIKKLSKRYLYFFLIFFIILSLTSLNGNRSSIGFILEDNFEYSDFIKLRQNSAEFISSNYPKKTVLVSYPMSMDLQHAYGGYVNNPIKVITYPPFGWQTIKNYTQVINLSLISENEYNLNDIDLYYTSPQEFKDGNIREIASKLNLTLIKRFELNNKSTEIYLVNK